MKKPRTLPIGAAAIPVTSPVAGDIAENQAGKRARSERRLGRQDMYGAVTICSAFPWDEESCIGVGGPGMTQSVSLVTLIDRGATKR